MLPYVVEIADKGFERAIRENNALCRGTYTHDGHCLRAGVAKTFNVPHHTIDGD